jgi:hypothetical protein
MLRTGQAHEIKPPFRAKCNRNAWMLQPTVHAPPLRFLPRWLILRDNAALHKWVPALQHRFDFVALAPPSFGD